MGAVDSSLRLSALRALLGVIVPTVRLVKVRRDGQMIRFTVVSEAPFDEDEAEAFSIAGGEILADFPDCDVEEHFLVTTEPLPVEHVLEEGWIYRRAEDSRELATAREERHRTRTGLGRTRVGAPVDWLAPGEPEEKED